MPHNDAYDADVSITSLYCAAMSTQRNDADYIQQQQQPKTWQRPQPRLHTDWIVRPHLTPLTKKTSREQVDLLKT